MAVFRNEIFGPVAPVTVFQTEEEAIALANDTEFGLASYFYTRDIGRVWRVSEALDYGIVGRQRGDHFKRNGTFWWRERIWFWSRGLQVRN